MRASIFLTWILLLSACVDPSLVVGQPGDSIYAKR